MLVPMLRKKLAWSFLVDIDVLMEKRLHLGGLTLTVADIVVNMLVAFVVTLVASFILGFVVALIGKWLGFPVVEETAMAIITIVFLFLTPWFWRILKSGLEHRSTMNEELDRMRMDRVREAEVKKSEPYRLITAHMKALNDSGYLDEGKMDEVERQVLRDLVRGF